MGAWASRFRRSCEWNPSAEGHAGDAGRFGTDMHAAFRSFAVGLALAVVLIYLVLMAQFASFSDPFVILLAVPPGVAGRGADIAASQDRR